MSTMSWAYLGALLTNQGVTDNLMIKYMPTISLFIFIYDLQVSCPSSFEERTGPIIMQIPLSRKDHVSFHWRWAGAFSHCQFAIAWISVK
jgi:hypothetical protein